MNHLYRRMIDDQTALETVHSPLFSPKIVEIERLRYGLPNCMSVKNYLLGTFENQGGRH